MILLLSTFLLLYLLIYTRTPFLSFLLAPKLVRIPYLENGYAFDLGVGDEAGIEAVRAKRRVSYASYTDLYYVAWLLPLSLTT